MAPKTMFEKIWDTHVVSDEPGKPSLLYVDLHLVHEITSAQAFDGLRMNDRKVRRGDKTVVVADHNVPTKDRDKPLEDEIAKLQLDTLANVLHHQRVARARCVEEIIVIRAFDPLDQFDIRVDQSTIVLFVVGRPIPTVKNRHCVDSDNNLFVFVFRLSSVIVVCSCQ